MRARLVAVAAALSLLVLAGCGGADPSSDGSATDPTTAPSESPAADEPTSGEASPSKKNKKKSKPAGTVVTTGDSEFGTMLFDENEQAIYIWEREPTAEPACYDDCATAWPPVLTKGAPQASGGVRAAMLGTTKRRDGSLQVTYNDHPLYFYADEAPGEVKCHNVATHGGLWWVVRPGGDRAP